MSTTLAELKALLDGLGTLGTIKIGNMPATPDVMGVIMGYGGSAAETGFGVLGAQYEHPSFQVSFRGAPNDYAGPEALAILAWKKLAAVQPGTISAGSAEYLTVVPQQSPFPVAGQDVNQRYRIGFNVYIMKAPS